MLCTFVPLVKCKNVDLIDVGNYWAWVPSNTTTKIFVCVLSCHEENHILPQYVLYVAVKLTVDYKTCRGFKLN